MGFAVGAHRVGIDVQPQLSSSVIKLFQLKTEAEDVAVVLDGEFQHAAGRYLFEREVRSGIVYIGFNITEAVAKPGGNHFLRHTESKSFHRAVSPAVQWKAAFRPIQALRVNSGLTENFRPSR